MKTDQFQFSMLVIFLLAGCSPRLQPAYRSFQLDTSFGLALNETTKLEGGDLRLTFTGIPEDSRCPTGVNCIWEGKVTLYITATIPTLEKSLSFSCETSKIGKTTLDFGDYTVLLEEVRPYPEKPGKIPLDKYQVFLRVSRKD